MQTDGNRDNRYSKPLSDREGFFKAEQQNADTADQMIIDKDAFDFSDEEISLLSECRICPRNCGVNRFERPGACGEDVRIKVASMNLNYGEEPPISGYGQQGSSGASSPAGSDTASTDPPGSGTIFFTGCNMACIFCQNFPISQLHNGRYITMDELVNAMLRLQKRGAYNINFVTPSHYAVHIIRAVTLAREQGLSIPIVYNTSGYDSLDTLKRLKGIVDIYLTDIRYQTAETGQKYSGVKNYPQINHLALKEMHRQVGVLQTDDNGIATRGLIIRHLVLPENLAETEAALKFVAKELSPQLHISLMSQYFPAYKALNTPPLDRRITEAEYDSACQSLEDFGLEEGWVQDLNE